MSDPYAPPPRTGAGPATRPAPPPPAPAPPAQFPGGAPARRGPDRGPRRRTAFWLGAAVASFVLLLVVLVVGGALVTALQRPSAEVDPQVRRDVAAAAPGLTRFVERTRGLSLERAVPVEVVSPRAYDVVAADPERAGIRPADRPDPVTLHALGRVDSVAAYRSARADRRRDDPVLYDTSRDRVVVSGDRWDPSVESALVAGLTVALQDAAFDLGTAYAGDEPDEVGTVLAALSDADAARVATAYAATRDASWRARAQGDDRSSDTADREVAAVVASLERPARAFVAAVLADGGQPALDRAFRAPPTTSAQLLDPAARARAAAAAEAPAAEPGREPVAQGSLGVAGLALLVPGSDPARPPAGLLGWRSDRYTTWYSGPRDTSPCTAVSVTFGSDAARDRALRTLAPWVGREGTGATRLGAAGLRLDACA